MCLPTSDRSFAKGISNISCDRYLWTSGVITKDGKNPAGDGRSSDRSRISNSSEWN
ncbi:hypothetical protein U9R62_10045 [Cylindrospermopsis raciborskii DSH]|uniref:hypothetical protein n=1 Tax=Cylindrospermopsis raciborskii TaxID=77022 RepID=UPI002EDA325B